MTLLDLHSVNFQAKNFNKRKFAKKLVLALKFNA